MSRDPHLFVALSGHGFGHLAMTAPVLNALRRRLPALRLSIQCPLPRTVLQARIEGGFELIPEATDFGMHMASALEVRIDESLEAYRAFHRDWETRLVRQSGILEQRAPDAVFANIPYLPLAAAARLGIPAMALSSLNWADVLRAYARDVPDLEALLAPMRAAYNSAALFLQPAPSMAMPDLTNTRPIGPIAALGRQRRAELNSRLGLNDATMLVVVSLGGFDLRLPMERWPQTPGVHWLVPAAWEILRPDTTYREALADVPFPDLLRSADAFFVKPGYGSFTEAVCNGVPVLYVERGDWPEEPFLTRWLHQYGNGLKVERHQLESGAVLDALRQLLAQPRKPALAPSGTQEAASHIYEMLGE